MYDARAETQVPGDPHIGLKKPSPRPLADIVPARPALSALEGVLDPVPPENVPENAALKGKIYPWSTKLETLAGTRSRRRFPLKLPLQD